MEKDQLGQALRESLEEEVAEARPSYSLARRALLRLEDRERRMRGRLVPRSRLAWALTALAVALIGGTAYAATSLVRDFIRTLAPDVDRSSLVAQLNLSQTIDGVTVNLEAGYADANTVLLGYTITGQKARYDSPARRLSIAGGLELPATAGLGHVPSPDVLGWHPSKTTVVSAFDGSAIQGNPPEVQLRFETSVSDAPATSSGKTWGPFVFDFTLPFQGGKTVIVGQTVEEAGIAIRLEKVLISPAGTSAVFSFSLDYEETRQRTMMTTSLQPKESLTDGANSGPVRESFCQIHGSDTVTYYRGDFTNRPGEWTLTVHELVFIPRPPAGPADSQEGKADSMKRNRGPWVFSFHVP